jgi:hypothetical protein
MFLYKEDSDFDLAGNFVQVWDDISPKKDYQTKSLDGACFLALSEYSVVDMMNPTYSGVVMGVSKQKKCNNAVQKSEHKDARKSTEICGPRLRRHLIWHNRLITPS